MAEANYKLAKESLISNIRTSRVTKRGIIMLYLNYERMGYKGNIEKELFMTLPKMTMQDIINFNKKYVKGQHKTYMVLGREKDMDFNALGKYGKVQKLSLKDIFGY